jgi:hypothetical protein
MKITKVCCQGCGANLEVDETLRFVTCNYCNSNLEVVHDATVTHTRQLEKIQQNTNELTKKLRVIELQNDVEHLDREWENFRVKVSDRDQHGHLTEPSQVGAIIGGILGVGGGIVWIIVCLSTEYPAASIVGVGISALAFFMALRGSERANSFQMQRDRYQAARQGLLHRLEKARGRRDA